jgi:hypothetical protein
VRQKAQISNALIAEPNSLSGFACPWTPYQEVLPVNRELLANRLAAFNQLLLVLAKRFVWQNFLLERRTALCIQLTPLSTCAQHGDA